MKKYIFFIRDYNDWDNIGPIIYYLAKNTSSKISICFYKKDLRKTALYKYLDKTVGNNLEIFLWRPKKLSLFINYIKNFFFKILFKFNLMKIAVPVFEISEDVLKDWFKKIGISKFTKLIVVFDRTLGSITSKVSKNLKGQNFVFISCSHGPQTNVNRLCYVHEMETSQRKQELLKYFEKYKYLIISDYLELEFNDKFINSNINEKQIDKSRIAVLGSLRYSSEWIKHIDEFTPQLIKKNNNKKNVVLFMKKFTENVFKEEVYRTIQIFKSFTNIDFYIKPHTRGMQFFSKINAENIHIIYDNTSTELINMADVILFYGGTGIILEALSKKKLVACLDYLDCNRNIYEYFNACHNLRCRDDLYYFLNSITKNNKNIISGDKLLKEIVYARDPSSKVSDRFVKFFENL